MATARKEYNEIIHAMLADKAVRRSIVRKSHYLFFCFYLSHYMEYEMAPFHREMFNLSQSKRNKFLVIMAARGFAKSTILNLSYALWSILGEQKKKFVLIISGTHSQARYHFMNIREELKNNPRLAADLGPFETDDAGWGVNSLSLPKMGARISLASREQALRGIRSGQYRPDLIICDDLEDSRDVESIAERTASYQWFVNEVMSAGSKNTNGVVLGNLLHEDSLLMRLKKDIEQKKIAGVFRAYPLLDDDGRIMWPGKYGSQKQIEALQMSVLDTETWEREYLLKYRGHFSLIQLGKERDELTRLGAEEYRRIHPKPEPYRLGEYRISAPTKL